MIQVIIVMCGVSAQKKEEEHKALLSACQALEGRLVAAGIRAEGDYRDNYLPGWKFNHWELKVRSVNVALYPVHIVCMVKNAIQKS